ncbi:MAG: MCE family protein [Gammaproteobacteria bacterium]|nr:MCE family protein [Gammaproteobacteria bacterium]
MEFKVNYALVGAFVIGLGALVVATTLWLGFADRDKTYVTYVAYLRESVSGLREGAPVKYLGVEVGRVGDISIDAQDPQRVRLLLDILLEAPIKHDTVAVLSSQGLTGIAFIELRGGSAGSPDLLPDNNERLPELKTGPSLYMRLDTMMSSVIEELHSVSYEFKQVAQNVAALIDSQNIEATTEILNNVRKMTEELSVHMRSLTDSVDNVSKVSESAARIAQELPTLVETLNRTLSSFQMTAKSIADAAGRVDKLAGDAGKGAREIAGTTLPELARTLDEIRALAETLNRFGQELSRDPALILRGRGDRRKGPGE